jgi:hypothetical protein
MSDVIQINEHPNNELDVYDSTDADSLLYIDSYDIINKTMLWLDQKAIRQTDKYWGCIYVDRLFNIIVVCASGISIVFCFMDLIEHDYMLQYIMFVLLITIFISIVTKLFFGIRDRCIKYHSTGILYKQILCDTKKKMACDLTKYEIQELYQKINNQIMYIDSYNIIYS